MAATFRLRRQARFHNGDAVTARDVKHTFDMLLGPHAAPGYRTALEDLAGIDVLDERTVRFRFVRFNRELPLTVGSIPIFSHKWGREDGKSKPFDEVVMDTPIGSGPYRIGPVRFGKDITYVRDPGYWARDLNVRRGSANFDRITVGVYKDITTLAYQGTHTPGQEYVDLFGSQAAGIEASGNLTGIRSPAIDDLLAPHDQRQNEAELLPACRALERVISHMHILIPQWTAPTHRIAYNAWKLHLAGDMPAYASADDWAIHTWWSSEPAH